MLEKEFINGLYKSIDNTIEKKLNLDNVSINNFFKKLEHVQTSLSE